MSKEIRESSLLEPLLVTTKSNDSKATEGQWPCDAGARFIYEDRSEGNVLCMLKYSSHMNRIVLVPETSDTAHHELSQSSASFLQIDPSDIIGAQLSVSFDPDDNSDSRDNTENDGMEDTPLTRSNPKNPSALATLNIFTYPRVGRSSSSCSFLQRWLGYGTSNEQTHPLRRHAKHYKLKVAKCEDFGAVNDIIKGIKSVAGLDATERRRILVVLNPHSGTGKAASIFHTIVSPMLSEAGCEHVLFVTKFAGHATERMMVQDDNSEYEDLASFDGIIALGGDGILYEIMQGLQKREDYDEMMQKMIFGIVGCGTSNGLAKSILHESQENYGVLESTFLICRGKTRKVDLATYQTISRSYTAFLSYSYGFVADCDLESEVLHFLGPIRTDIWAVWRILCLRHYRIRLSYLPERSTNNGKQPSLCDVISEDEGWQTIEDDIITIWACQTSHASFNLHSSPDSTLSDGLFHILLVRGTCSRFRLIQMFLNIDTGGHVHLDQVEVIKCRAFRLEPTTSSHCSFNDVDGEAVENGTIQGCINPGAMNIFATPK